jgi:hypothetical protein
MYSTKEVSNRGINNENAKYKSIFDFYSQCDKKEEHEPLYFGLGVNNNKKNIIIKNQTLNVKPESPSVWGPPLWFTLHNSSSKYPNNPSPITRERMKNIITNIPVLLPCYTCREHATQFIEKNANMLDDIVSSRDKLFNFFVDFHNQVNKKLGKKIYSYEEARALYK